MNCTIYSADSPVATLELLLVIIKIRLVAYLQTVNLTVVRAVIGAQADADSAVPAEQVLLQWLNTHLTQSKSAVVLNPTATPKL
jgi:hypothetical protein